MRDLVPPIVALVMGLALSILTVEASISIADTFVPKANKISVEWADKVEASDTSLPFANPDTKTVEVQSAPPVSSYSRDNFSDDGYSPNPDTSATEIAYKSSYHYYGHFGPRYGRMLVEP